MTSQSNINIQDNNMGSESTQSPVRMPELEGPIHQQTHISATPTESDLTMQQAETFPTWSISRSGSSPPRTHHNLATDTPNNSLGSTATGVNQRIAYANDTNQGPAELSAYDHNKDLTATPSSSSSPSRSRSRSRGAYDTHRSSQDGGNVWTNDTEGKHKRFLKKVFDHKLAPEFLK